jgi:hypothetical protein
MDHQSEISTELHPARSTPPVTPSIPASDAAAWSLVALLTFCVICFAWGAAILGRRERRILQASQEPDDHPAPIDGSPSQDFKPSRPRKPWEREPDWWKK